MSEEMSGDGPTTAMSQASIPGPGNLQTFDSDSDIRVPTLDHNDLDNKNDSDIDSNIDDDTDSVEVRHNKPDDSVNHIEFVIHMADSRDAERSFRLILNDIAKGLLTVKWHESIEKCQACLFVYRSDYVKAGCHLICSASAENALFHAQQAVSAYQQVYTAGEPFPCPGSYSVTDPQRMTHHRLLALAIRNLIKIYQEIVTTISKEFLIGVHRIEFPSAEDLLEAVKSLTITYKKHMSADPKLSGNPGQVPKNLLDDEEIHEEKNAIAKETLLEHEEDTKSFLDEAVKDADMLVGNGGIPGLEGGPDNMTRLEIVVAFARTIIWSCAEDLLHPQVRLLLGP